MWTEIFLSILILWLFWSSLKKPSNYPPGPWGFPVFGYIPFGLINFTAKFQELKQKHGDIFCWRLGSKVVVFLCDFDVIKEAYQSFPYAARPQIGFLKMIVDQIDIGITFTNGIQWNNIRKFALRHLRDLGMGKSKLESAVQFEAMEFVKELKKQAGKPSPVTRALKPAILNVLWQMVASKRYELDDKAIVEFDKTIDKMERSFSACIFLDIFPWIKSVFLKKFLTTLPIRNLQLKLSDQLVQTFDADVKEHISTLDENNPRDFIDGYLIEMEKQKSDPDSMMSTRDLIGCIADLFAAGFETTTYTIYWAILYLANFPEVQSKLQKEIDNILPNETLATLEDKSRLPYTEAFINEVLRYSTLAAFGVPRTVLNDTILGGYTIPKDAIILSATESLHFDPAYFDSPKEFRPERFLNSEGKLEVPKEGFFPFGIGKRQCLGESLARMELLIFLTTMLKHLTFAAPPNKKIEIRPVEMPVFNQPRLQQDVLINIRK